jgi:hypothetical protein
MPANNKSLKEALNGKIAPQHFDQTKDDYDYTTGENGAINVNVKAMPAGMASDAKLDSILEKLGDLEAELTAIKTTDGIKKIADTVGITASDNAIAALGALAAAAVTDPAASASVIALLKGLLKQLQGTGTGAAPVTLTGSLDEVYSSPEIVDIVVAAGESYVLLPTAKRYDYKKVTVLLGSADVQDEWEVSINYYASTQLSTAMKTVSKQATHRDMVVFDVESHQYSIRIKNTHETAQTIRRYNITGIR